jgi:hypothetical protein
LRTNCKSSTLFFAIYSFIHVCMPDGWRVGEEIVGVPASPPACKQVQGLLGLEDQGGCLQGLLGLEDQGGIRWRRMLGQRWPRHCRMTPDLFSATTLLVWKWKLFFARTLILGSSFVLHSLAEHWEKKLWWFTPSCISWDLKVCGCCNF